jgi:hypothetical protein
MEHLTGPLRLRALKQQAFLTAATPIPIIRHLESNETGVKNSLLLAKSRVQSAQSKLATHIS